MGTWGVGIFEDDMACDIRDQYTDLIESGVEEPEASRQVIQAWENELSDQDIYPVFWLALAAVQLELQRLDDHVKTQAIDIIENDRHLALWQEQPQLLPSRKAVLSKLKDDLEKYKHKPPKQIKKRKSKKPVVGDILEIPLSDGRKAFCQFLHFDKLRGYLISVFDLITMDDIVIEDLSNYTPLFPPVLTFLTAAMHQGWKIVGHLPVNDFKYPKFLQNWHNQDSGEAGTWQLYDGENFVNLGRKLPRKYKNHEMLLTWNPYVIVRRIETGEYPFPYDDLRKKNKFIPRQRKGAVQIGDIFSIPLSDGRNCYGQYIHRHNLGEMVRVFKYFTTDNHVIDVAKIVKAKLLFPPVNVILSVAIEDGIWQIVGHSPIKNFKFPKFVWGISLKNWDEIENWSIYDGKNRKRLGSKLPKKYWRLENINPWAPKELVKRIETGINPNEKYFR
ncbi:MAG: Imm26 family immunity protein [Anaerolineae bacterium]|nr:Imm26 family immunity protein [Anaerolineae bacterium]